MDMNIRGLKRFDPASGRLPTPESEDIARPPPSRDTLLLGMGNSGEGAGLRCQALGYGDGVGFALAGINNDRLAPRPIPVRWPDDATRPLALDERLVLDGENPRDQIADEPLLEARYAHLLRGLPVFETYPRAGAGGHGHPVIAALDLDLQIDAVLALLRRWLGRLRDTTADAPGLSPIQRTIAQRQRRQAPAREPRIVLIGGGCGAMGNAALQLLPYLIRWLLAEQGIGAYELWGVVLGPRAFSGLTPFVRHNYRALLEAIEHMSRYGQRRSYRNDLAITLAQPPYDRVFLLDDPALPGSGPRVTEAELEGFLDQAALSLYLLLRGNVWETVASHIANDDGTVRADGRLRYLHTVYGVLAGVDRRQLADLLAAGLAERALAQLLARFDG